MEIENLRKDFKKIAKILMEFSSGFEFYKNDEKVSKKMILSLIDAYDDSLVELKNQVKKKKKSTCQKDNKFNTPNYISDQFCNYLNSCNFGNGLSFVFFMDKNLSVEKKKELIYTDCSTDAGYKKIFDMLNKNIDYYVELANSFEKMYVNEKKTSIFFEFTKENLYSFINPKKNMNLLLKSNIMPGSLAISVITLIDDIEKNESPKYKGYYLISEEMKKWLLNSEMKTNLILHGVQLKNDNLTFLEKMTESENKIFSKTNGKKKNLIIDNDVINYNHMLRTCISSSYYRISKDYLTQEQNDFLKNENTLTDSLRMKEYIIRIKHVQKLVKKTMKI